jgi:hypothetical protein
MIPYEVLPEDYDVWQAFEEKWIEQDGDGLGSDMIRESERGGVYADELESYIQRMTDTLYRRKLLKTINAALMSPDPVGFIRKEKLKLDSEPLPLL